MKKERFILFSVWFFAVIILLYLTTLNYSKVDKFMGLTASKEHTINFPYSVELQKIFVTPGQQVNKGDLLAELVRSDLISKINILNSQISELEAKFLAELKSIDTKIENLNIEHKIEINKLNLQIRQKQQELKINKALLKSVIKSDIDSFSKLSYEIKSLKQTKKSLQNIYLNQKEALKREQESIKVSFAAQFDKLLEEKKLLSAKENRLSVYSPIDGKVGNIFHSENSQIKPFDPLFKIYSKYPEFVTGYIYEDSVSELRIGQRVAIKSSTQTNGDDMVVYGVIKSIENRIEEIPAQLKRYKILPLWGYKVIISLPKNNLQLGKKVIVTTDVKKGALESKIESLLAYLQLK